MPWKTIAAVAVAAATAGCSTPPASAPLSSKPPVSSPHTSTAPASTGATNAQADLATLQIRPDDTGAHYSRPDWGPWTVQAGCDTRERVLKAQGTGVKTGSGCKVTAGAWTSPYDGVKVTNPAGLDIDHVVPVKEANQSGARDWSSVQRSRYYNDLDNLVAVTAHSNRAKGDQDPATWLPAAADQCVYVTQYVTIKAKYGLSVDQAEHDAIASVLRRCP